MSSGKTLRSGELARLSGVSPDTLRYYERKKLLTPPPRTQGGYRCYPPDALARVQLIRRALGWGFSIDELARILKARDTGGVPCKMVHALAGEKLTELDQQLQELTRFRRELSTVLRRWDIQLARHRGGRAHLLESIAAAPVRRSLPPPRRNRNSV